MIALQVLRRYVVRLFSTALPSALEIFLSAVNTFLAPQQVFFDGTEFRLPNVSAMVSLKFAGSEMMGCHKNIQTDRGPKALAFRSRDFTRTRQTMN